MSAATRPRKATTTTTYAYYHVYLCHLRQQVSSRGCHVLLCGRREELEVKATSR